MLGMLGQANLGRPVPVRTAAAASAARGFAARLGKMAAATSLLVVCHGMPRHATALGSPDWRTRAATGPTGRMALLQARRGDSNQDLWRSKATLGGVPFEDTFNSDQLF